MKFTIFSHVEHVRNDGVYFAYGPYIREMNLWISNFDKVEVVAHLSAKKIDAIDLSYAHDAVLFTEIKPFEVTSISNMFKTLVILPAIVWRIFKAMQRADHIHLRCPGNVGLLACFVQILFPSKKKTAKYAGNWDPQSKQPWSYRLQQWILNNTFLTKNMKVLVYGEWEGTSKNILPFFTASYRDKDAQKSRALPYKKLPMNGNPIHFIFVGTLSKGKRPMYALQLFEELINAGRQATLSFYGEGAERTILDEYINRNQLQSVVTLFGNQEAWVVEKAFKESHFLILASQSEGWPKVVAEAMFWGCVPLATNVSCVAQMMGHGERGVILKLDINADVNQVTSIVDRQESYETMSKLAKAWSTDYTLEKFEEAVKKLL